MYIDSYYSLCNPLMNIFVLVPIGTHFQLMMHENLADINGCISKCVKCHPGNRKYLGESHVHSTPPHPACVCNVSLVIVI